MELLDPRDVFTGPTGGSEDFDRPIPPSVTTLGVYVSSPLSTTLSFCTPSRPGYPSTVVVSGTPKHKIFHHPITA